MAKVSGNDWRYARLHEQYGEMAQELDDLNTQAETLQGINRDGKTTVNYLGNRYTVFGEFFTPDECNEIVKHIKQLRQKRSEISRIVTDRIRNEMKVGGLLYKRRW